MAVLQMQKIHICAPKSERKKILEELQRRGTVQVEKEGEEDSVFTRMDTANVRSGYEKRAQSAENALKVLDQYVPEKKGMLASLEGKKTISTSEYYENVKVQETVFNRVKEILALQKEIGDAQAAATRANVTLESLKPWQNLDIAMNSRGTRSCAVILGSLPGAWTEEQILTTIAGDKPELDAYTVEVLGSDTDQTCLFLACGQKNAQELEDALRMHGFARPQINSNQTPAQYAEQLTGEIQAAKKRQTQAEESLKALGEYREQIRFVADYYTMRSEKYQVLGELLQSRHVFFVNGYIPARNAEKLKNQLESSYTCQVELEEIPDEEEAPVLLQNKGFSAPTESVVESYGLPHKGEIDPTAVMSVFYYFLFGLMLSDAGYGLIMVLGCAWALKKYPNMGEGMKKMLKMFFYCGISTTFWGVMFGGYFGDVVTVFSENFLGKTVTIPALWFVPLDDPMKLLMWSFLFGIIHLFTGLALKGYMLLKDHQIGDFICSVCFWYMLLIGLILMLLPTDMFASMAGTAFVFPGWLVTLSKVMAIAGAAGIVLFTARGKKNIGLRIALGAYELYGATSWLSDVLSYSRLLALGLATGVIASVINTMGAMLGSGIIGMILFAVVFLVGHTLNMAINLLGAYVHTNRLQYVEFFGKFFDGGGKPFRPFSAASTKYIQFKEEN
jgi:V/A-type H+-transporting ATPase subunit I